MENALIRLRDTLDSLNPAERTAAEYVLQDPERATSLTVHELAGNSYVSSSAVIRMCRDIGFEGYKDFRKSLIVEIALQDKDKVLSDEEIQQNDSTSDIIHKITRKNIQSLEDTERMMDAASINMCVSMMKKAHRIIFFGLGASWLAGRDAYEKLLRINKPCMINEDWHLQLLSARNSTKQDLGIIISYSGQTTEIIECMKAMKDNQTPMIVITRCVDSPISELADYKLYTTANESIFRSAAMSSRISQLNIVDILYTAYANSDYENSLKQLKKTHIVKP